MPDYQAMIRAALERSVKTLKEDSSEMAWEHKQVATQHGRREHELGANTHRGAHLRCRFFWFQDHVLFFGCFTIIVFKLR